MSREELHGLLKRQLKRYLGNSFIVPDELQGFIGAISEAYHENDIDRGMLERSLELSSQELLQANSEMRAVIQAFPDILFHLSPDGTILDHKTGFSADLLLEKETYRGRRIQDLSERDVSDKFTEAIGRVNETGTMVSIEYPLAIRGKEEFFEARLVPLPEGQIFVIIRNVTLIRQAQEELLKFNVELENIVNERTRELRDANERLQELDRLRTDFISSVSHELRTPLTAVIGFTHLINRRLDTVIFPLIDNDEPKVSRTIGKVREDISIIMREGQRLTALINDVLDLTRMEAGQMNWEQECLDLNEIIEHAVSATGSLIRQKGLRLTLELNAEDHRIDGDRDRLIQVMINLISNAVKFTEAGQIRIHTETDGPRLVVGVSDTGIGIVPAFHQRIFEKFQQVGNTLTAKPRGTGLGLPICRHIVEHHGGEIWVASEQDKGSTFSFALPLSVRGCRIALYDSPALTPWQR
jgi:signal transduction histidine kinase